MKFCLLCVVLVCVLLVAIVNLNYYRLKSRAIGELIDFYKCYANEISFLKLSVSEIIAKHEVKYSKVTQKILQNYLNCQSYLTCFNDYEQSEIINSFASIGKMDVTSEIQYCNGVIEKLQNMKKSIDETSKTKGELRSKLIVIVGIILILLLI